MIFGAVSNLLSKGIIALPTHDFIVVAAEHQAKAIRLCKVGGSRHLVGSLD